ncbi:hypothetical protein EDB86DRAFT_1927186 [Lactarius hatsudake]|nr:hypothetical protein EDB86DRAFT_1927186 [Lactarius hatsudake]
MAQLLRKPKSGSDWTAYELSAYNITVVPQSKELFFNSSDPTGPEPSLTGFMATERRQDVVADTDKGTKKLLHYLELAVEPKIGQEAAVVNFAAELLRGLGYDDGNRIVFIRHAIPFLICGENSVAQTDVCVMDDNEILLLLQEDKGLTNMTDPEPQVIAGAIAAFALNNRKRERQLNLPPHDSIMFPCLTMVGTSPIFYKVTVTAALSKAVQSGTYDWEGTFVFRYIPALPRGNSEGMRPLPNRLEILRCLEAFKRFLGN